MPFYDAFISYSHAKDKPIAAALQSVIQKLGKPWYRRRSLRVFRDDTSLSATPQLWPSIEKALSESRFLILLASPEAATSSWVTKEITYWLAHKNVDTLLIAITDGTLVWDSIVGDFGWCEDTALPSILSGRFAAEPKWVDLRPYRDGANPRAARFIELAADCAATIRGVPKEDLLSQEVRQQRRALALAWSAAGSLAVLIALAGWQWWEAERSKQLALAQRDIAERNFNVAKRTTDLIVFGLAQGLRDLPGMQVDTARQLLDGTQTMMDALAKVAPDDLELQYSRATMLSEFALTYARAGDSARAQSPSLESLAAMRKLITAEPDDSRWQYGLNMSLRNIGDLRLSQGDRTGALAAYEERLEIMKGLTVLDQGNAEWQTALSESLYNVGEVRMVEGNWAGALAAFDESLNVSRTLAASDPNDSQRQYDLSLRLSGIGDAYAAADDLKRALTAYEEALGVARKVAAGEGGASRQHAVSGILARVGVVRAALGDRIAALKAYMESLAIMRTLASADPHNAKWQEDLSLSLEKVGDVRLASDDKAGAIAAYEESLAIRRKLAIADPGNADAQRGVSISLDRVGDVRLAAGDRATALAAYEESLAITRNLATADMGNIQWQTDLVVKLYKVSTGSEASQSRAMLREALDIIERLARDGKLRGDQQNWPQLIRDAIARLPPANE